MAKGVRAATGFAVATMLLAVALPLHGHAEMGKVAVPADGSYFGIYPAANAPGAETTSLETYLGRGFDVQRIDTGSMTPDITTGASAVQDAIKHGRIPWITIAVSDWPGAASGGQDAKITQLARDIKSLGVPVYFTIDPDPEGELTATDTMAAYKAMWQHYHARFADEGVTSVSWVYVVKSSSFPSNSPDYQLATGMYPGDSYTDWIGVDLYNVPYDLSAGYAYCNGGKLQLNEPKPPSVASLIADSANYPCQSQYYAKNVLNSQWGDMKQEVNGAYQWVTQNKSGSKAIPIVLSFGSTYDISNAGRKAAWINQFAADHKKSFPQIKAVLYANFDEWKLGLPVDTDKTAFKTMGLDAFYNTLNRPAPDTAAPSVALTSPAADTYSGAVHIAATATDDTAVDRVGFLVNGVWVHTAYAEPYGFDWDSTAVDDGEYEVQAVAYDAAGNEAFSSPVTITVHNTAEPSEPSEPMQEKPVIHSFTATPSTVPVGGQALLAWSVTDADHCSIAPGGPTETLESEWLTPELETAGTHQYALTCANAAGSATAELAVQVPEPAAPPLKPVVTASSTAVESGQDVLISWTSENAASCTLQPGNHTAVGEINSYLVTGLKATTTFSVTCHNDAGSTASDPLTITVANRPAAEPPEIVSFTATPDHIAAGGPTLLAWQANNAIACRVTPSASGNLPGTAQLLIERLNESRTYVLACENDAGQLVTADVSVTVDDQPAPAAPDPGLPDASGSYDKTVGDGIVNGNSENTVTAGDLITLTPDLVTDAARARRVTKVEYYVNEKLAQTVKSQPFAFDTSHLAPGTYTLTERVYYDDGSVAIVSRVIHVRSSALAFVWNWWHILLLLALLLLLWALYRRWLRYRRDRVYKRAVAAAERSWQQAAARLHAGS